jgi:hypothetical protein
VARHAILRAAVAAVVLLIATVPAAGAGGSKILRVAHVGPDAGILEVIPDTVQFSAVNGSVSVGGTLVCPAEAASLGVVVSISQGRDAAAQAESWDSVVQCGGRLGTTATAAGDRPFGTGPATIRITAFVCDRHCGTDVIDVDVILVPSDTATGARGKHR